MTADLTAELNDRWRLFRDEAVRHAGNASRIATVFDDHRQRIEAATLAAARPSDDLTGLAKGIQAGVTLRLLAGATDQTYTATEVAEMVAAVITEQVARLEPGEGET